MFLHSFNWEFTKNDRFLYRELSLFFVIGYLARSVRTVITLYAVQAARRADNILGEVTFLANPGRALQFLSDGARDPVSPCPSVPCGTRAKTNYQDFCCKLRIFVASRSGGDPG